MAQDTAQGAGDGDERCAQVMREGVQDSGLEFFAGFTAVRFKGLGPDLLREFGNDKSDGKETDESEDILSVVDAEGETGRDEQVIEGKDAEARPSSPRASSPEAGRDDDGEEIEHNKVGWLEASVDEFSGERHERQKSQALRVGDKFLHEFLLHPNAGIVNLS
jgi:hypothetical protein